MAMSAEYTIRSKLQPLTGNGEKFSSGTYNTCKTSNKQNQHTKRSRAWFIKIDC